ncbi:MAG TPA: hypothetical protein VLL97_14215, partial [Acidobacteriota bacterium]|nr:hypothetical protein [Acidobacteriota bacterium]
VFKTAAFNHSAIPPQSGQRKIILGRLRFATIGVSAGRTYKLRDEDGVICNHKPAAAGEMSSIVL